MKYNWNLLFFFYKQAFGIETIMGESDIRSCTTMTVKKLLVKSLMLGNLQNLLIFC